jgi:restriction system protein
MNNSGPLLPHGGYRKLRTYKVAEVVYDATVVFCRRFLWHDRRLTDQVVQASPSGVRNISEGSGAAATSRKSEMKLTNVARASLSDELCGDYASFLIQNGLRVWPKDSREGKGMRQRLAQDQVGEQFWGCSSFPICKNTLPVDQTAPTSRTSQTTL